jgi:RND family efflux transporter MFP subunit
MNPKLNFLKKKKVIIAIAVIILAGGYWTYKNNYTKTAEAQYITSPTEKGTLTVSVSGTGQVSASNQVDIKPNASGKIIKVAAKQGQQVKAGDTLVQLDAGDAQDSVRDAQANLDSAKLSLEKLKQPADSLSIMQAQNALASAKTSYDKLVLSQQNDYKKSQDTEQTALDNIVKSYEDSFNDISNAFLDLPGITSKLNDILYSYEIQQSQSIIANGTENGDALINTLDLARREQMRDLVNIAENDYQAARTKYDQAFSNYKDIDRYSDQATIESMLNETLETAKSIAQAEKSANNMLNAWVDLRSQEDHGTFAKVTDYQSDLSGFVSKTNSHISNILSAQTSLKDNKNSLENAKSDLTDMDKNNPLDLTSAKQSIDEKQASLDKLLAGPDSFDLKTQQLSIQQKQNALSDAREKLADYSVKAPLSGTIASFSANLNDQASSATAIATIITDQQIAEVSLNEVDVAKIKTGQKTTLTFDAVDGLTITGTVAEIDSIGTVTQGVVSYNVKIAFDTQDDRIKPGMSATANILTDVRPDVLLVPSAAVKTQGNSSYVQILENGQPKDQTVQIGLSNDTSTEIMSGLNEGDSVVTQTITSTTAGSAATSQQKSGTSLMQGLGGGGGTMIRAGGNASFGK